MQTQIGEKICNLRKLKGLTQAQLAEKLGIDNKHLSRIETGKHLPTFYIIKKLSEVLDFNVFETDEQSIRINQPDKIYLKSLRILNSAKTEQEKKYYLEVLKLAQKGIKIKEQ